MKLSTNFRAPRTGLVLLIALFFAAMPPASRAATSNSRNASVIRQQQAQYHPGMICATCDPLPGGGGVILEASNQSGHLFATYTGYSAKYDTSFTSTLSQHVTISKIGDNVTVTFPTGQVSISASDTGTSLIQVSARAEQCPDGDWIVDPAKAGQNLSATVIVDRNGNPIDQGGATFAKSLQRMLWCNTSSTRSSLWDSAELAGFSLTSLAYGGVEIGTSGLSSVAKHSS